MDYHLIGVLQGNFIFIFMPVCSQRRAFDIEPGFIITDSDSYRAGSFRSQIALPEFHRMTDRLPPSVVGK
jgi:hypothetical protein